MAHEVKHAKNAWFQEKVREVEMAMHGGKGVWNGLRTMQRKSAGPQPVRLKTIRDCSGNMCMGADNTLRHWHGHFETILNVHSSFMDNVVQSAQQRPVRADMMVPPTEDKVMRALSKLRRNKARSKNGILPEMLKSCGGVLFVFIMDLFGKV